MNLDESGSSRIDDSKLLVQIREASKGKPAWIGDRRPEQVGMGEFECFALWARTHYLYYVAFVPAMERRGRVLDLGCGNGQNAAMLARYADEVVGLDPNIEFAEKYNKGCNIRFQRDRFPVALDAPFDYIFSVETIEHIEHGAHVEFIKAALAALKPDGRLFITTPNEQASGGDHVGIWDTAHAKAMMSKFAPHIVRQGFLNNKSPEAGIGPIESTHYALVFKP